VRRTSRFVRALRLTQSLRAWSMSPAVATLGARAVLGAGALLAALRPHRRPGEALTLPPAVVVSELQAAPTVVYAAPTAVYAAPAAEPLVATDSAAPADSAGPAAATAAADSAARRTVVGSLRRRARTGEQIAVKLTAYCLKGITRAGTRVRPGVAAGDPKLFPLRRHVDVFIGRRWLGRFRVDDTGGAVRGPHLDIWTASCADARRFGRRRGRAALTERQPGQGIEISDAGGKALGLKPRP